MNSNLSQKIIPIEIDLDILKIIDADQYNAEHSWDISNIIKKVFSFRKEDHNEQKIAAVRSDVINQLSQRSLEQVYELWRNLGIDDNTISCFLKTFALEDVDQKVYSQIIPDDSAELFVWFRYGMYPWEDLGKEFGIFTYLWLYGFFFPEQLFKIPAPKYLTKWQQNYFLENYDVFRCNMTVGRMVQLILLYQDNSRAQSILFEPDLPWKSSELKCNISWKQRLKK